MIAFSQQMVSRPSTLVFLLGKFFRFGMYFLFLVFLLQKTSSLASYTPNQALLVFLIFTLVDSLTQMFFRGAYMFRPLIVEGGFDFYLVQPMNPLFRSLTRYTDIIDLVTLIPLMVFVVWFIATTNLFVSIAGLMWAILLIINAILIGTAAHILVLAFGILYLEVDNALWLYRDLSAMGRFPIDIYQEPLRSILTFIIPLGIMFLFPAQALFGTLNNYLLVVSLAIGPLSLYLSLKYWQYALKRYSSASS